MYQNLYQNNYFTVRATKPFTFAVLLLFILSFPLLEGLSNEYLPVGTKILGLFVAFVWLIESCYFRSLRISSSLVLFIFYLTWNVTSQLWSIDYLATNQRVVGIFNVFVFYWIIFDVTNTESRRTKLLIAYVVGISILGITLALNLYKQQSYNELYNRFSATGTDPNNYGIMAISAIPIIYIIIVKNIDKIQTYSFVGIACILMLIVLAFATGSRAAFISFLIVLFGIYLTNCTNLRHAIYSLIIIIIVLVISYIAGIYLVPDSAITRLTSSIISDYGGGRLYSWQKAFEFGSDKPLTGIGAGAFLSYMEQSTSQYVQAHNTFLSSFAELGVIGFSLWTALWGWHFLALWRLNKAIPRHGNLNSYIFLSLIVVFVGAFTLNWEIRKPIFFLWGIIAAQIRDRE